MKSSVLIMREFRANLSTVPAKGDLSKALLRHYRLTVLPNVHPRTIERACAAIGLLKADIDLNLPKGV